MRVYHFVNREYGLDNLRKRRLKIATINELNDPFEMNAFAALTPSDRAQLAKAKKGLAKAHGLLCFSRDWSNPVQWGHYAHGHRGLCLGFDVPDKNLMPVTYVPRRLILDSNFTKTTDASELDYVRQILSTKFNHWRYEKELRTFVRLSDPDSATGFYFADFSEELSLQEVIVGHCSDLSRSDISDAIGPLDDKVTRYKARLAYRSFKVVRTMKQELWK